MGHKTQPTNHIATMPACSSGTLTNVLPHWNAMLQTQDLTPHPLTLDRHRADLLCYPLMWNIKLEYTTFQFYVLGQTNDLPHTAANAQLYDVVIVVVSTPLEVALL